MYTDFICLCVALLFHFISIPINSEREQKEKGEQGICIQWESRNRLADLHSNSFCCNMSHTMWCLSNANSYCFGLPTLLINFLKLEWLGFSLIDMLIYLFSQFLCLNSSETGNRVFSWWTRCFGRNIVLQFCFLNH